MRQAYDAKPCASSGVSRAPGAPALCLRSPVLLTAALRWCGRSLAAIIDASCDHQGPNRMMGKVGCFSASVLVERRSFFFQIYRLQMAGAHPCRSYASRFFRFLHRENLAFRRPADRPAGDGVHQRHRCHRELFASGAQRHRIWCASGHLGDDLISTGTCRYTPSRRCPVRCSSADPHGSRSIPRNSALKTDASTSSSRAGRGNRGAGAGARKRRPHAELTNQRAYRDAISVDQVRGRRSTRDRDGSSVCVARCSCPLEMKASASNVRVSSPTFASSSKPVLELSQRYTLLQSR